MTEKSFGESTRRLLPMLGHTRGKRSAVTCALKCNNACLDPAANISDNSYFKDIVEAAISRRSVLGAAAGAAFVIGTGTVAADKAQAADAISGGVGKAAGAPFSFSPIAPVAATVDELTIPAGFKWEPIIRWGDPLFDSAGTFDPDNQTAYAQERQFGYNNDYLAIIPDAKNPLYGVLVCNHEYTNEANMFTTEMIQNNNHEAMRVAMMAHGMSVVELMRKSVGSPWTYVVNGRRNRRITTETPFHLDGPAAGSALLKTVSDPAGKLVLGTNNNCSGGLTPWGTVLSGEENFANYFVGSDKPEHKRYNLKNAPTGRRWEDIDPRYSTHNPGYENEVNRYGWVVELDPQNPHAAPRKHTAMGRFAHEGANVHIDPRTGQVAAYMGDDSKFEYIYKFVSRDRYIEGNRKHNMTLLENGSLYVAQFSGNSASEINGSGKVPADGSFDGTGKWIQLTDGVKSFVPGMSLEEVLVYTRMAADKMGATKMDRPEDVEPSPYTGKIYAALTNNDQRGTKGKAAADEANPRNSNRSGHIIEISEDGQNVAATTFTWDLLIVCGDPEGKEAVYFSGFDPKKVSPISCPDNVAFDSKGNLWIATDGAPHVIQKNDGLFKVTLTGAERGMVEQFLSVPCQAETCGPVIHDQEHMVYVAVQHPGEEGTRANPTSHWPDFANVPHPRSAMSPVARRHGEVAVPRPAIVQVYKA